MRAVVSCVTTSVAARSPERTAPSMKPYMRDPPGTGRAGPNSVSTPGGVCAIIPRCALGWGCGSRLTPNCPGNHYVTG